MCHLYFTLLLGFCLAINHVDTLELVRNTVHGQVRGYLARSKADPLVEFYAFRGVPYGRPPLGKLRFQEPIPPEKWSGIKNTTSTVERCPQIDDNFNGKGVVGKEDCLYLDVFEPITSRQSPGLLPVMVWFHGGNFIFGTINSSGADFFMEKPVVIVIVEYRVNVFGFLSSKDKYAEGNAGLKDQLLSLKWVKKNIKNFGGDPNSVTIFGESAGGASVVYHMLSKRSQGYFHKGISQSGTALDIWAHRRNPKEICLRLARGLGIQTNDTKEIIERLQTVDYRILLETAFNQSVVGFYTPYYAQPFTPSLESESDTAFLTESMYSLLQTGKYVKVPYMAGFNTEEGSFGYDYIHNGRADINLYKRHPEFLIPISMNVMNGSACSDEAIRRIKHFYFKSGDVTNKHDWINFMTQQLFVRGIVKTMELLYQNLKMFFYRFSYNGSRPMGYIGGVAHFEEMQYLWYLNRANVSTVETEADKLVRKRMVTLWTNFAKTGNPTPQREPLLENVIWPQVNNNKPYLAIDKNISVLYNPNKKDSDFWERLFESCGNPPYLTY